MLRKSCCHEERECGNRRNKIEKSVRRARGEKESKLNLLDFYDYCALTFSPGVDTANNNNNIHSARAAMNVAKFAETEKNKESHKVSIYSRNRPTKSKSMTARCEESAATLEFRVLIEKFQLPLVNFSVEEKEK